MQVPSNLIMNTIPYPRLFMAAVVSLWGLISALTSVGAPLSTHEIFLNKPLALRLVLAFGGVQVLPRLRRCVSVILFVSPRPTTKH